MIQMDEKCNRITLKATERVYVKGFNIFPSEAVYLFMGRKWMHDHFYFSFKIILKYFNWD